MKLQAISDSYVNLSGEVYDPDFINLANIVDGKIAFDKRTRFLNDELKNKLNSQQLDQFENAVYIVEHKGKYCLICDIDLDDYREGKLITHELVLPDTIQGMLSNLQVYNAETAPTFLISADTLDLHQFVSNLPHHEITIQDINISVFTNEEASKLLESLESIRTLIVGDGHHRLYTSSLFNRKPTIMTCIMNIDDVTINSIDRIIHDIQIEDFQKAKAFIDKQFKVTETKFPLSKGSVCISYRKQSFVVNLIDLESDAFWNNDVYRLNTQILSQAFGIYDTSQLDYFVNEKQCLDCINKDENSVRIQLAPISKDEVLFVSKKKAIMPPKSTAFGPKFPSFLIFKKY